jgi:hypothetical protein
VKGMMRLKMGKYWKIEKQFANVKAITQQQDSDRSKTSFSPFRSLRSILMISHNFLSMLVWLMVSHLEVDKSISRT